MKNNLKKFHFQPDFYFETAKDFCFHLGFDKHDIANVTGYHPKTAQKWIDSNDPPQWLLPLLYAISGGVISCDSFYGWNLKNGLVNCPGNRYGLTNSQIEAYHWHIDLMKQYQFKLQQLQSDQAIKKANNRPGLLAFTNNGSETV